MNFSPTSLSLISSETTRYTFHRNVVFYLMAKNLACACGWKAKTREGLDAHRAKNWCGQANEISSGGRSPKGTPLETISDKSVKCLRCGRPMIIRVAKKGRTPGQKFYGCTGFPLCKHTLKIEEAPTLAPPRVSHNRQSKPVTVEKHTTPKERTARHPMGTPRPETTPGEGGVPMSQKPCIVASGPAGSRAPQGWKGRIHEDHTHTSEH